ncbi:GTPase HflX [Acetobacter malorum]|uniref:GTPase HflX n=1 Tax=Acetobacter malorum TaxID=178901 RepID=UPI0015C51F46|nr:GTPase HflX [Acetobacter malorum]
MRRQTESPHLATILSDTKPVATRGAVILPWEKSAHDQDVRAAEARLEEAVGLAASIGLVIVLQATLLLRTRRSATLLGKGQVDSLKIAVQAEKIDVLVVDARLSPAQQRNLETEFGCKVIDRTGLILDIFGARAATKEGTLQVELAHLEYQRSRLVRLWTHLERQRGGFGFLGGPGETQIEADRRMIGDRIVRLKKDLEQVRRTRGLHRQARKRVPFPVVALVGYTNAGKSTLFNALTGAAVYAKDQLFATLDPTMRAITLPSGRRVILSDTVGFISDLPTELIAAFRATLEEVAEADIILHVRDIAHPDSAAQKKDVFHVLEGMARDNMIEPDWSGRMIEVLNKIDLLGGPEELAQLGDAIGISAITGDGLPELMALIDQQMTATMEEVRYRVPLSDGAASAWLYQHGEVLNRKDDESGVDITVRIKAEDRARFEMLFKQVEPLLA